ncbi:MAG TPA: adenylate/guanylate cyclase domain-containing protein [Candidatus Limnocylindria bacterium]|nr:adenylate/guanylate cyclase domain-containing protein [Candidatus Limnocylindria bacterium]
MSVDSVGLSCPSCQSAVPPDARFCANCGQPLAGASADDTKRQSRLTAAAPAPLVDKMRATKLTGERKPVTALFADIVGSTALAERMDPEDWTQIINEAFDLMSKAVFRYEGTIAQLQGDAMLAFFGAPVAHEDDPERAVRAALDMVSEVEEFARQLKQVHGIEFAIRAGINSGPVVVGNVGTDLRYEYTALGDAVNTAARMQSAAEPGTILIAAGTQRHVAGAFELEDRGEIEVKGKSEPVHAYRVLAARATPANRRGLASVGLESPMVGRDAQLRQLLDLCQVVRAGRGRLAFVLGEPGIGKSRLLIELRRSVETGAASGPPPLWLECRCVSYGQSLPYHLLLDLVRGALQLPLGAAGQSGRERFDDGLRALLGEQATDVSAFLAHLLNLPLTADEADRTKLDRESLQQRYAAATHRLLRAMSARQPLVVVAEDVHWADAASVAVFQMLLPLMAQHPILFLAALRPDTESAGWQLVSLARQHFGQALAEIVLEQLSDADSRALVANLLVIESLPPHVRDQILARADGNPFFVEEVVRMLIERGVIERQGEHWRATAEIEGVEIPATLHGLLLARIDQLPDAAKRSLRVASVIGRQFPVRVLERVLSESMSEPLGESMEVRG